MAIRAAAVMLCIACSSDAFGLTPAALIAGVASRSRAVASGRITYTLKSESFAGERALKPIVFPETTASFFESSWAERSKGSHLIRSNHNGYFLEFAQTPQRDGSIRSRAIIHPPRSLESRTEVNVPPVFAGSFWYRQQLGYAENHAADFQVTESSAVNGVPTTVLELEVGAENHAAAFHVLLPALKSGGSVRLYVAAQLGFVLPRVEFLTPSRQVTVSYDAADFTEAAPGLYFPGRIWTETHAAGGASRYRAEFTVRGELINQTIPEEDFIVEMPLGTKIQDAREPDNLIKFELTESSISSALPVLSSELASGPPVGFLDRWRNAVILGGAIGTIASISLLIAARSQRSRA